MLDEKKLKNLVNGKVKLSVHAAIQKGIVPDDSEYLGGYRSLAEKLNAEAKIADGKGRKKRRQRRMDLQESPLENNNG